MSGFYRSNSVLASRSLLTGYHLNYKREYVRVLYIIIDILRARTVIVLQKLLA